MKEYLIELGSVFDLNPLFEGGDRPWLSPYPASVYIAAQKGEKEHPLCAVIADQLQAATIENHQQTLTNAPTGCAVDIGAFLSGEPDCMLSFDGQPQKAPPINFALCLSIPSTVDAIEFSKGVANCFAALQSIALTRPVTVTPYLQCFTKRKIGRVKITLKTITLTDTIDIAQLALISDSRTVRQFAVNAYKNDDRFEKIKGILIDQSGENRAVKAIDKDDMATTYADAMDNIARIAKIAEQFN